MTQSQQFASPPPAQNAPKPTKFGALAWTSLILGLVGILGSPIILLNNLTAIVAALGLILGIIALFGTKRILALIGIGLCVAGIAITVAVQGNTAEELDKAFNDPGSASGESGDSGQATWGERFTWESGVTVRVSKPATCTPSEFAGVGNNERAVKFAVTVISDSDESVNTVDLTPSGDATFNDRKAETIFDSGSDCGDGGMASTTVLPGKKYSYDVAYAVGQKPGELQLVFDPMLGQEAVFIGKV
ncbi:MAG: hypothetical protein GEU97_02330 [Actinophytocola sp.]|nr:hypothetical protein [Actinophytocola sp.]